MLLMMHFEA